MDDKTLTEGGVAKGVLRLAAPMLISALLQNLQSIIDIYWVGYLGKDALAAVAISGTIFLVVFPLVLGACAGAVALVSRAVGAGNSAEAEQVAGESWRMALILGVVMGAAGLASGGFLTDLMGAEGDVRSMSVDYLNILFAGCFTVFVLFVGTSIFHGAGNTVIPMTAMILSNMVNICLDPVLIFGNSFIPAMGIRGAAAATVAAQALSAALVFVLLIRGRDGLRMRILKPDMALIIRIARVGLPGTGQMFSRSVMSLVLMKIVANMGMAAAAAYGIGLRIHMIILMPAFAIGNAVATMVGQNLGAGKPDRATRSAWLGAFVDSVFIAFCAVGLWYGAGWISERFTDSGEIQALCVSYLKMVSPFYVFVGMAIVLGRGFMGAGDTVPPFVCTVISLWGLQVPLAIILPRYFTNAVHGVWWAIAIAVTVHGIMVAVLFSFGRWKLKKV